MAVCAADGAVVPPGTSRVCFLSTRIFSHADPTDSGRRAVRQLVGVAARRYALTTQG